MFKVTGQLTNVRPSKSETAELSTAPSKGMVKINVPGAKLIGVTAGDFVTIVPAEDESGKAGLYLTKGSKGDKDATPKVSQVGAVLSFTGGNAGGSLQFGSENAWKELGGNKNERVIFDINTTPVVSDGKEYFEITVARTEAKLARKPKGETAEA